MSHEMLSSYQGPSACKEPFLNDVWFSTADALALLQNLEVYLAILQLELAINSHGCYAYHRYSCPVESPVLNGPCNTAHYTAACTCYRAFMCSGSHWRLAAFQSPSIWVGAEFSSSEFPQRSLELGVHSWWPIIDKMSEMQKFVLCYEGDILTFKQTTGP